MRNTIKEAGKKIVWETGRGDEKTPDRFVSFYTELLRGALTPRPKLTTFPSEESGIVCVRKIRFFSVCEHHLAPFYGRVSIAYIPGGKILGLSKFARIVDWVSRRPQTQERMTHEIITELVEELNPQGVLVVAEGKHLCMMARGVEEFEAEMLTSEVCGEMMTSSEARSEAFSLLNSK